LHVCVIVRDALPGELSAVGDLRVAAYRSDGFLPEDSGYAPVLRALGADGNGDILVAADGPHLAGPNLIGTVMLRYWPDGNVLRSEDEAEIRALAVAPAARGRGVGRALLDAVMRRAAERGVRYLTLLTEPGMVVAQHMYTSAGFVRLPDRDWSPRPGQELLAYGRPLAGA
jgi:ribosomal protein S18 acetylase RimI-like enzyme